MASIISAGTTDATSLNVSSDKTGILQLASNNAVTAVTIDTLQRVGIGTTSPTSTYRTSIKGDYSSIIGGVEFDNGGGDKMAVSFANATSPSFIFANQSSTGVLRFDTNATERMRIDSSGNVGINTSSPAHKLDVQSNFEGAIVRILNNRDTTGSFGIKVTLGSSGGAGTTGSAHFHGNTNAVGNWYLYGNGTTSYSSDQRLKKNIETTRDGYLEDLARLRVVKFNWNVAAEGAPKELGLIAQEVEQVFPGLVQDDANPVTEGDDTVYKQLKQSVLPFMLLKAIQELKVINDTQAETINALTARIEALENK